MPTLFATPIVFTTTFFRSAVIGLLLVAATLSGSPISGADEISLANALTSQSQLAANIEVEPDGYQATRV